jgi:hypothetical protein
MTHESAAYGLYPDRVALNDVLRALGEAGFDKKSICMMLSPRHPIATIVRDSSSQPFERENNVITAGLIGWLSEFGAVVIPKFGFFVRSREFYSAVMAERSAGLSTGPNGTLAALGFSDEDAKRFDTQLREDGVLLYVSCPEVAERKGALELLRATGANEAGLLESQAAMAAIA